MTDDWITTLQRDYERARHELRKLNEALVRRNNGLWRLRRASAEVQSKLRAERNALQARLDATRKAIHVADPVDITDWQRGYRACSDRALTALQGDQPTEPPGLCDGCDRTDMPVKASDDGRAQFCPTCLPIANAPAEPETHCMNGPAKQHTLRMVEVIKALKAAAVNGQLPATVEPLPFVKIARAIVDHWPTGEVDRG